MYCVARLTLTKSKSFLRRVVQIRHERVILDPVVRPLEELRSSRSEDRVRVVYAHEVVPIGGRPPRPRVRRFLV